MKSVSICAARKATAGTTDSGVFHPDQSKSSPSSRAECSVFTAPGRNEIPLPGDLGLVSGQPLRLARRRFDAVFPVPAAAVVAECDRRSVWIAGHDGTAELREVTVIDASEDALVSAGLRVGDQVIVDPPATLRAGTRLALTR